MNKSVQTKLEIKKEAARLFYDKGIDVVSLDEIAAALNISKGLITYHFTNKKNLVVEIRDAIMAYLTNDIALEYYLQNGHKYDKAVAAATSMRINLEMQRKDPNTCRFLVAASMLTVDTLTHTDMNLFRLQIKEYNLPFTEDEICLVASAAKNAVTGLVATYFNNQYEYEWNKFLDYRIGITFSLLKFPENQVAEIVEQSREMAAKMKFNVFPYFIIRFVHE